MKYYLVGGAVRDLLLGKKPREYDYSLDQEAFEYIMLKENSRKVGKSYEICIENGIEYSRLRGNDIYVDLLERDLTINALALDGEGRIYAHPQALNDLKNKILAPCSELSFKQDPVRVYRAARFHATFPDFSLSKTACLLMAQERFCGSLEYIAAEQLCNETIKALNSKKPGNFLRGMLKGQVLTPWFKELEGADDIPAGPVKYHNSSVLEHTATVMDSISKDIENNMLLFKTIEEKFEVKTLAVWMGLCHDLGKTTTDKELLPRHFGHELRGINLAIALGTRLKMPTKFIKAGEIAVKLHTKAALYSQLRSGTKVKLLTELHYHNLLRPFLYLLHADSGLDLSEEIQRDLHEILAVKLPDQYQNQGKKSGEMLQQLRILALNKSN
ncbi:hypothetical protein [Desulfovibrio litoralis]|uniref:tRNA nucleotidyltransferase (CCA-adding enzyme) n=1 Tax=Desulfovibrio litoralis DSM 11393 TaxID=1121455 RepID=A0A1M7SZ10_9BACT|nr:hypothetical protein [Desulfovibrio litoralis]SHN63678.1 tRNA nucleotidyltransferase (CCA-adding enzyme) [Desulfovibrio litoralis DSM 11393]